MTRDIKPRLLEQHDVCHEFTAPLVDFPQMLVDRVSPRLGETLCGRIDQRVCQVGSAAADEPDVWSGASFAAASAALTAAPRDWRCALAFESASCGSGRAGGAKPAAHAAQQRGCPRTKAWTSAMAMGAAHCAQERCIVFSDLDYRFPEWVFTQRLKHRLKAPVPAPLSQCLRARRQAKYPLVGDRNEGALIGRGAKPDGDDEAS